MVAIQKVVNISFSLSVNQEVVFIVYLPTKCYLIMFMLKTNDSILISIYFNAIIDVSGV